MDTIASRLKAARIAIGKTQDEFAKAISVTGSYIGRLENGKCNAPRETLEKLCYTWGINGEWLLFGTGAMLGKEGLIPVTPLERANLPARVKSVRKSNNLTQNKFAEALHISRHHVIALEQGKAGISDALIERIAYRYNISADWLRTGKGEMADVSVPDLDTEIAEIGEYLRDDRVARLVVLKAMKEEHSVWLVFDKVLNEL